MRPSVALDMKRSAVREATSRFRAGNPRGIRVDLMTPAELPLQLAEARPV